MILPKETVEKEIAKRREKADAAYMNYNETGNSRYEKSMHEHEDWADTLKAYVESEKTIRSARTLATEVKSIISTAKDIEVIEDAEKKEKAVDVLIETIKQLESVMRYV